MEPFQKPLLTLPSSCADMSVVTALVALVEFTSEISPTGDSAPSKDPMLKKLFLCDDIGTDGTSVTQILLTAHG